MPSSVPSLIPVSRRSQTEADHPSSLPRLLLQHFDSLADTPDAVPRLRALVLDLAIRGALVPQNPEDPPARPLVELARTQMKQKRKLQRALNGAGFEPASPFLLPQGWCWTCLNDLGDTAPRNDLPDTTEVGFAPMRLITAKFGAPVSFEARQWAEVRKGFTHFADGDVVVAKITPCFENGKSGVIRGAPNGAGAGTTELHVFRPVPDCVIPEYALVFLKSPHFLVNGERHMTGSAGQKRVPWDYFAIRLLTAKNVRRGFVSIEPQEFISEDTYKGWMTRGLPRKGDVLFTTEAPLGNAAVLELEENVALAQRTIDLRPFGGVDPHFIAHTVCSPPYQALLREHATGMTATGIKAAKLKFLPFPLPPLAEQKRIVAKVEELMRWCDQLESHLATARTTGAHVLDAILRQLLEPAPSGNPEGCQTVAGGRRGRRVATSGPSPRSRPHPGGVPEPI